MYLSKRSHDLVNKVDYSKQVEYNPPSGLGSHKVCKCDHPLFSMPQQIMKACTAESTDISSVQNKHDQVHGISI